MVHTRRQIRRAHDEFLQAIRNSVVHQRQPRRNFWDQVSQHGWEQMLMDARRRVFPKRYKPEDTAHRHRLEDEQDKDVSVRSYTRRS